MRKSYELADQGEMYLARITGTTFNRPHVTRWGYFKDGESIYARRESAHKTILLYKWLSPSFGLEIGDILWNPETNTEYVIIMGREWKYDK